MHQKAPSASVVVYRYCQIKLLQDQRDEKDIYTNLQAKAFRCNRQYKLALIKGTKKAIYWLYGREAKNTSLDEC